MDFDEFLEKNEFTDELIDMEIFAFKKNKNFNITFNGSEHFRQLNFFCYDRWLIMTDKKMRICDKLEKFTPSHAILMIMLSNYYKKQLTQKYYDENPGIIMNKIIIEEDLGIIIR